MAKTTFSEEIYLRALTGKVISEQVLANYNKIVLLSVNNTICAALSAATEAVFVAHTGGRAKHVIIEQDNVSSTMEQIFDFDPDALIMMFGGETPIEQSKQLFSQALKELAANQADFDIIIHVRIFAAGGLQVALQDPVVKTFVEQNELGVYTFDLDQGLFLYHSTHLHDGEVHLHKLLEAPVSLEHSDLLNRSLRDKTIEWKDV